MPPFGGIKINIAVLGQSGVGKSSFINAILGLTADDEGAAAVGCAETTSETKCYEHPNNKNFLIWDFPGVGTKHFPKEEYLATADFCIFEFFILISYKRFCENDIWLANAVDMTTKNFYFVRSMFGNDVENYMNKGRNRGTHEEVEKQLKLKVFEDCKEKLREFNCEDRIFIIDSYEKNSFDFPELESRIVHDASVINERKHNAIALSLSALTKPAIIRKKLILEKRIPRTALRAAFALCIRGSDVRILFEERTFFRNQLQQGATSLETDGEASDMQEQLSALEHDMCHMETHSVENEELLNEIRGLISSLLPFKNIVKTYKASKTWLKKTLDGTAQSAIDINETMFKALGK